MEFPAQGEAALPAWVARFVRRHLFFFLNLVSCSQPHILDVPPQFVQLLDLFSSCVLAVFVGHVQLSAISCCRKPGRTQRKRR
jgi:hypothetical protein